MTYSNNTPPPNKNYSHVGAQFANSSYKAAKGVASEFKKNNSNQSKSETSSRAKNTQKTINSSGGYGNGKYGKGGYGG